MTTKLSASEIKVNRAAAELATGYGVADKALIGGKNTETVATLIFDTLLVGDLDGAKSMAQALAKRERVHRLTFHPEPIEF